MTRPSSPNVCTVLVIWHRLDGRVERPVRTKRDASLPIPFIYMNDCICFSLGTAQALSHPLEIVRAASHLAPVVLQEMCAMTGAW
jgi:hypothetical protein